MNSPLMLCAQNQLQRSTTLPIVGQSAVNTLLNREVNVRIIEGDARILSLKAEHLAQPVWLRVLSNQCVRTF